MTSQLNIYLRRTLFLMIGIVLLLFSPTVLADNDKNTSTNNVEYLGMQLLKGHLHSHTALSDGIGDPDTAYNYVKNYTNLDFFAVTEHDVTYDISTGSDFITDYNDSYSDEYKILHEQSNDHNVNDEFITLPGTEVTWYDESGHMNLFNAEWFARTYGGGTDGTWGWGDLKYDLPTFYSRLSQDPDALAQFNHPRISGNWSFSEFKHYNKDVDHNINGMEYKSSGDFNIYVKALDRGWHISPVFGGDEHKGQWGAVQPHVTNIWTNDFTRQGIYDALRNRRTYVSFDRNFEMAFSANGEIMGSILPADTEEIDVLIDLKDPDAGDDIDKVVIYKNGGEVVKEYLGINDNEFTLEETFPSSDGDYFFVIAYQLDGDEAISAPIWIGPETRGTEHAPNITIEGEFSETVQLGDIVELPDATAKANSGEEVSVEKSVINSKGFVNVSDNQFEIDMYGNYFIKYVAEDKDGNIKVELIHLSVDGAKEKLNADKVLNEFQPLVNVGVPEDGPATNQGMNNEVVGINLVTDNVLDQAFIQYRKKANNASQNWNSADLMPAKTSYFEVAYGDNREDSNYRVLAAHEVTLSELGKGKTYEYRYGISENGPWSDIYTFETAPKSSETVMYVMGDLEVPERNPDDFQLFNNMLNVLQAKNEDGSLMIQVGDLVENGGHIHAWSDVYEYIYKDLDLISANIVGDREQVTDRKLGGFAGFFNLPKNGTGSYRETNYSFDYGDAHIAVINSLLDLDEQLEWLEDDLRATNKKWKIVMGHYPYYGGYHSDETGMDIQRLKVSRKFEQLGVSLYIGGHDHVYKRTTIRDGQKDVSEEAMNLGTTFVTVGSSGPIFYDDVSYAWDHIVYDEKKQTGVILEANDSSLSLKAYNSDGDEIDSFIIEQPENYLDLTSVIVENNQLHGIGMLNYPGSIKKVTVIGEKYDHSGENLIETRIKETKLEHLGREQLILFDETLQFEDEHLVKVSVVDKDDNPIVPPVIVNEGLLGDGSEENPFRIKSVNGMNKIHEFPDKHFVLEEDIDGNGQLFNAIGANGVPFTGTFDGQGHTISNVTIATDGAGLFAVNEGLIRNVGMTNAHIDVRRSNVGILVDQNDGTVEYSYSSGSIKGNSTVGGLVGYSNGIVRDSYSTALVQARGKQAGGVVGITNRGSVTENIYATGSVSAESSNTGGLSGYAYNNTTIQNSVALNPSVVTGSSANRIVGRVLAGETATLVNNYADENIFISSEGVKTDDPNNERGQSVTTEELSDAAFYIDSLGWDFEHIWTWDETANRPLLRTNLEIVDNENVQKPPLSQNDDGYYLIESIDDLQVMSDYPDEKYMLMNDLDFAGKAVGSLFTEIPLFGEFDGNYKKIYNYSSETGGLFHLNGGTIKNVAMIDAIVDGGTNIGVLVNVNSGTVEQSFSTGTISGASTVGGLVGYSNGTVRNSYSNVDVTANVSQAGGLIGITNSGSLTENVYANGAIHAVKSNAGGVTGYGYNETVVRNVIALNPSVLTPTSANRVMGRVLAGHTATLENNFAFAGMEVDKESVTEESPTNIKGASLSQEEVEDSNTYVDILDWNFDSVWIWDENENIPVLKSFANE